MVRTKQNCVLFDKKKMVKKFWQSADAILEDVSVTETIVWMIKYKFNCGPKITTLRHVYI